MLKNNILSIFIILSTCSCCGQSKEEAFIAQYEFEDLSQFKGTHMFHRGKNKEGEVLIAFFAPSMQNKFDKIYFFNVFVKDSDNIKIVCNKDDTYYDTVYIVRLVNRFIDYKISALEVDTVGNVKIDIELEDRALFKFANENEKLKRSKEMKWFKIKGNWYKPKH
jgi:hypothetical protein